MTLMFKIRGVRDITISNNVLDNRKTKHVVEIKVIK